LAAFLKNLHKKRGSLIGAGSLQVVTELKQGARPPPSVKLKKQSEETIGNNVNGKNGYMAQN